MLKKGLFLNDLLNKHGSFKRQKYEVRLSSWSLIGDQVVGTKLSPGPWSLNESSRQWEAEPLEVVNGESDGKTVSLRETWRWR